MRTIFRLYRDYLFTAFGAMVLVICGIWQYRRPVSGSVAALTVLLLCGLVVALVFYAKYRLTRRRNFVVNLLADLPIPEEEKAIDLIAFDIRRIEDAAYYRGFLAKYFDRMEEYALLARESIVVLDYLAHHKAFSAIHSKELARSYQHYFWTIEEQALSRSRLSYVRVMQLPLGEGKDLDREELVYKCVELMFLETLNHIKRMYESSPKFELYILAAPLRPYSYLIVDGKYILSEYDRYNKAGISLPDHLIVNRADSENPTQNAHVRLLIEHHLKQLQTVALAKQPVSLAEIYEAVRQIEFKKRGVSSVRFGPEYVKVFKGLEKKQALFSESGRKYC